MHGIVSLLDNDYNQLVEELWAELKQEFSVHGVYVTPYPHFSYQVAQDYDVDKIEPVLQRITEGRAGKPPSFKRGMNRRSLFGVEVGGVFPHFRQRKRRAA